MNIKQQAQESSITSAQDFAEGCKQMSAEAGYAFRKIIRDKFNVTENYLNECTKEFIKLLLT